MSAREVWGSKEELEAARAGAARGESGDERYVVHARFTVLEEAAREIPPSQWRELPLNPQTWTRRSRP